MKRRFVFGVVFSLLAGIVLTAACVLPTAPSMGIEQNKALARRFFEEAASQHKPDLIDELFAPDYVLHDPANPMVQDRETFKQFLEGHYVAFPDVQWIVEDVVAEGDRVVVRWTLTGTHQGPLLGIPPTGKKVRMRGISIYRIAGGKIAEEWAVSDVMGFMQQLGVIPAPGAPPGPPSGG